MTSIHHIHNLDIPAHLEQVVPQPFSVNLCQLIARALIEFTQANKIVIAHSYQDTDTSILNAFVKGLSEQGANIIDIGHCNEEQLYFALRHFNADAGALIGKVTMNDVLALRNFTFLNKKAQVISQANGLHTIWSLALQHNFNGSPVPGSYQQQDIAQHYLMNIMSILHCLSPEPLHKIKPLKAIIHCPQSATKLLITHLNNLFAINRVAIELIEFEPELESKLAENSTIGNQVSAQVKHHNANLGITFNQHNGCEMFDQLGNLIKVQQISHLISQLLEDKYAKATVVTDNNNPLVSLNHSQVALNNQAIARTMANSNAMYGASCTGNHFFQHTGFAPSLILPWLFTLLAQVRFGQDLSTLTGNPQKEQSTNLEAISA